MLGFRFPMTLSLIGMLFSFACTGTCYAAGWVPLTVEPTPRFCLLNAAPIGVLIASPPGQEWPLSRQR